MPNIRPRHEGRGWALQAVCAPSPGPRRVWTGTTRKQHGRARLRFPNWPSRPLVQRVWNGLKIANREGFQHAFQGDEARSQRKFR